MKKYLLAFLTLAACAPQPLRRSTLPLTVVEVAPPITEPSANEPGGDAPDVPEPRCESPR